MIKVFGCLVNEDDAKKIINYLTAHYGRKMNYPAASCEVSKLSFRLVRNLSSRRIPDALRLRE